jgi:hypothetical protein
MKTNPNKCALGRLIKQIIEIILLVFKERIKDMFVQNWHQNLVNSNKCRFYVAIKDNYNNSKYIETVNVKAHREALTRLLVSSHHLSIESGRWNRPQTPRNERFCPFCPHIIEDEYHFVLQCSKYNILRKKLISDFFWKRPSMYKLTILFNNKDNKIINGLAKYVYSAFQERDQAVRVLAGNI